MTIPVAGKIGMGVLGALGFSGISYWTTTNFSLYEIEKQILDESVLLKVSKEENGMTVVVKKGDDSNSPWTCKISVKEGTTLSSVSELEKKLPTEENNKTQENRQKNKSILVYKCAENRLLQGDYFLAFSRV